MRFTVSSSILSSRLGILSKVISTKNTLSILDCFLFEIKSGKLILTASDNSTMLRFLIDLNESDGDCSFCVPNRIILTAVKELADQPLTFEVNTNDNSLRIIYQNGTYNIIAQPADEYPIPAAIQGDTTCVKIPSGTIASAIQRALFATANDELRPVMNGLYFDFQTDKLNIVASDGRKMVRNSILNAGVEQPANFILPKKPAALLRMVLSPEDEGNTEVRFNANNAEIEFADGFLSCRLIEGRYPNYAAVIPTNNPNIATIDRKAFISALRRVIPFASESTHLIKMRMNLGTMDLLSEDIDFATSANESVMCDYQGVPMSIGFNGSTLTELLNNLEGDDIVIALGDPSRAGVIQPATQPEMEDVLMIIMPMLLNE